MKILILGLNYLPESTSIGPYTADLAEYLRSRGHDARVTTGFPTAPQWKAWKGYEGKWFQDEVIHGVPIQRTYLYVPRNPRKTLQRILFDCSFAISALRSAFQRWSPEVVVVISPPLQLGITGFVLAALNRSRVFLVIKDLVPDAAIAVGAMRPGSAVCRLAQAMERLVYRRATRIAVICDGMRRNLMAKGVPADQVVVLPDYIDLSFIKPQTRPNRFRSQFGISEHKFLAMYSGSVAGKQGLQTFIQAAAQLDSDSGIVCCLIGEGPYLPELKNLAASLALSRFFFLALQPRENLAAQLSAADALVITQRETVRDVVFPGKLLYYMASGRAILAAVNEDSETGRFIREHDVGIVVPPEAPDRLAEAIRRMRENPEKTRQLGLNGRRTAEAMFDRSAVLEKFAAYIENGLLSPVAAAADEPQPIAGVR
ncbi:MAG TPA: WcaI family glycosyltransferase [Bryobacteraceae bacterium]|nr:WcaI family glycosyltransferase [Bryobacteraceae bacterium]